MPGPDPGSRPQTPPHPPTPTPLDRPAPPPPSPPPTPDPTATRSPSADARPPPAACACAAPRRDAARGGVRQLPHPSTPPHRHLRYANPGRCRRATQRRSRDATAKPGGRGCLVSRFLPDLSYLAPASTVPSYTSSPERFCTFGARPRAATARTVCRIRPGAMTARGAGKRHAPPDRRDGLRGADLLAEPGLTARRPGPPVRRADIRAAPRQRHGRHGRPHRVSPPHHNTRTHGHRLVLVPDGAHRPRQPVTGTVAVPGQHHGDDEQYPTSTEQIRTIVTSGPAVSDTVGHVTTRNPQPEAVAAARQMLEPRVQSIADLAHAHDLVNQRRAQATAAETALAHAVTEYAERYATARRAHGWTPAELGELGFPDNPPHAKRTRTHRRRATPTNPTRPPPPAAPGPTGAAPGGDRNPRPTDANPERGTTQHRHAPTPHAATGAPPHHHHHRTRLTPSRPDRHPAPRSHPQRPPDIPPPHPGAYPARSPTAHRAAARPTNAGATPTPGRSAAREAVPPSPRPGSSRGYHRAEAHSSATPAPSSRHRAWPAPPATAVTSEQPHRHGRQVSLRRDHKRRRPRPPW